MISRRAPRLLAATGLVGSLLLVATSCGSEESASLQTAAASSSSEAAVAPAATDASAVPQESVTTAAPAATEAVALPSATAGGKVNVNSASASELEAAFDAAGVTNARRWAREVEEYRPYPSDPDYGKLRQELGKYNISPDILELIISTLEF